MITLDKRPVPPDDAVIRDVALPCLVEVRDPTGRHFHFGRKQVALQQSVLQQGGIVLRHTVLLPGGATMHAPPAWVTPCPDGLVIPPCPVPGPVA